MNELFLGVIAMAVFSEEHVLEPIEAARLIFNIAEPTDEQVQKIEAEINRGALRRSRRGGKTTSAEAVALYFARQQAAELASHASPPVKPLAKAPHASNGEEGAEVTGVYQTMLRDYFLGIFLQRQSQQYPDHFQQAVLAGQILLVVATLAIVAWAFSDAAGIFSLGKSPQRIAVEKWIAEKHGPSEVILVAPGPEENELVVNFRYRAKSGKPIETQRIFRVEEGNVSMVVSD